MFNFKQIIKKLFYKKNNDSLYVYDKRGVRGFVKYQPLNGLWEIEIYRKKTEEESEGTHDWRMIRVGFVQSFYTRKKAEKELLKFCEEVCKRYKY